MSNLPGPADRAQPIEDQLRALVESGDSVAAVTRMMNEYGGAVRAHALAVLRDQELAKDAYQQTFLEVHRDLRDFDGRSTFRTWLMVIARRRAIDLARKRSRDRKRHPPEAELPEPVDTVTVDPIWGLDLPQVLRALDECLQLLSEEVRSTVLLRCKEDLSYEEMARGSGERSGTLHARVARALPVLRECLEKKGISL
jgi:RNA polymerase sigma-70 factor (ECF subfamily)